MKRQIITVFAILAVATATIPAKAAETAIDAMQEYMEFSTYGAGIILPRQLTKDVFNDFLFIDTRDAGQYQKGTIPGAKNIEWREVLSRIDEIPTDKKVILFCNTGTLSSQALFALRVAGRDNALVLQTGYLGWKETAPYKP